MPLPVTKGELNRLGSRLIESQEPSEADLGDLAPVLAYYQDVLENVKAHLRELGFAPTGRVKTITTMLDKLRRTQGMDLSGMQDVAGARIRVTYIAAQDKAKATITEFFANRGCECREVDRRKDPRFGYRAVHLIVRIEGVPIEIQIRTDLQDTWAQVVERLADRWGRGIRYGQDPERPDSLVHSDQFVVSRREAMNTLMSLSDSIATTERRRQSVDSIQSVHAQLNAMMPAVLSFQIDPESRAKRASAELSSLMHGLAKLVTEHFDDLDEDSILLLSAREDMTLAQVSRMIKVCMELTGREVDELSKKLSIDEQRLRDRLRLIADATDEEDDQ